MVLFGKPPREKAITQRELNRLQADFVFSRTLLAFCRAAPLSEEDGIWVVQVIKKLMSEKLIFQLIRWSKWPWCNCYCFLLLVLKILKLSCPHCIKELIILFEKVIPQRGFINTSLPRWFCRFSSFQNASFVTLSLSLPPSQLWQRIKFIGVSWIPGDEPVSL